MMYAHGTRPIRQCSWQTGLRIKGDVGVGEGRSAPRTIVPPLGRFRCQCCHKTIFDLLILDYNKVELFCLESEIVGFVCWRCFGGFFLIIIILFDFFRFVCVENTIGFLSFWCYVCVSIRIGRNL